MATLYLVSTPIGNLADITFRARETLRSVDYIACEDTRRTGIFLKEINCHEPVLKTPKLISFYEDGEIQKTAEILNLLQKGYSVALISDAGTPLISDPGYKLVSKCLERKIKVVSIPGPSAVIAALTSSGLPSNSFWFLGFIPPKTYQRLTFLKSLKESLGLFPKDISTPTIIFYESPHRLVELLIDLKEVFGNLEVVLARELTKIYETIERKNVNDWLTYFSKTKPQGEYVLLFTTRM